MPSSTLTVASICHSPILTCGPDTPLAEAARMVHAARCSSIVIEEGGRYIGIWTEHDALKAEIGDAEALLRPIREVMSAPIRTIPASLTLAEATVRFIEDGLRHYLVHDESGSGVAGIVSQTDLVLNQGIEYYLRLRDVRSIVTAKHPAVTSDMAVSAAAAHMRHHRLDATAVVYPDGGLGILSERDVVRLVAERAGEQPVGAVASRPLIAVAPSESLYAARALLCRHNIRHLGIVDAEGRVQSLLSFSDILTSIEHDYLHELRATLQEREEALALSRGKLRLAGKLYQTTAAAIVITDGNGLMQSANPACCRLTGYDEGELIGRPLSTLISPRHKPGFQQEVWLSLLADSGQWRGELWSRRRNGEALLNLVTISGIEEENGRYSSYAVVFADIVTDEDSAARLRYLSIHDGLTGLPNRTGLTESLEQACAHAEEEQPLALLVAGIDRINLINESMGFAAGDDVLAAAAERIVGAAGKAVVARLGGDEFAILAAATPPEAAATLAERILGAAALPMIIDGVEVVTSVSIGVAFHPGDGPTPDDLLNSAHAAMTAAKQAGRNRVSFFTAEADCRNRRLLSVEAALRKAIEREELEVHFQPKLSLADGRVVGMEALARWTHPLLGAIPPSQFIPIAEDAGLIAPIGEWVLERSCRHARAWLDRFGPLKVAVNLSGHQVAQPSLKSRVADILERTGLPADHLELELTETVAMADVNGTLRQLKALAELGICLSIDDFGTGYSSFSYLHRFPLNKLKIDRSFVAAADETPRAAAIPMAIVSMAHTLGLSVVAEGIETAPQRETLARAGCDEGQGYYFSRPLPADMFEAYCHQAMIAGLGPRHCPCAPNRKDPAACPAAS